MQNERWVSRAARRFLILHSAFIILHYGRAPHPNPLPRGRGRGDQRRTTMLDPKIQKILQRGVAIPASPLALDRNRKFDERRQRALCRYYFSAGAGGLAVGVHTTQFAIRDPKVGLFEPLLALVREELDRADGQAGIPMVRVA